MNQKKISIEDLKENPELCKVVDKIPEEVLWYYIDNKMNWVTEFDASIFTQEMIDKCFELALISVFRIENLDYLKVSKESILKGIKEASLKNEFFYKAEFINNIVKNISLDKDVALAIVNADVLYITDKQIAKFIDLNDAEIHDSIIKHLTKENLNHVIFPEEIVLNENDWEYLSANKLLDLHTFSKNTSTLPVDLRHKIISEDHYNIRELKPLTVDDISFYVSKYFVDETSDVNVYDLEYILNSNEDVLLAALEENPRLISKIKKPKKKECIAVLDVSPENLKYIKNPTEAVILYALKKDISVEKYIEKKFLTDKILKFLGKDVKKENLYPEDFYYVSIDIDLADESNIIYNEIIKGKNMSKFMNSYFTISFGNLIDDDKKVVSDYTKYTVISKEEVKMLKRLELDSLVSGYFNFDVE